MIWCCLYSHNTTFSAYILSRYISIVDTRWLKVNYTLFNFFHIVFSFHQHALHLKAAFISKFSNDPRRQEVIQGVPLK